MKARDVYRAIRNRKRNHRLTLQVRMVIMVQIVLLLCVGMGFLMDRVAHMLNPDWSMPLPAELVVISIVLGGAATSLLSRLFFDPIKELRQAIDRVAEGDFSVQIDHEKAVFGEVKEVLAGFNLMAQQLSSTEVLQTDFVSNVSHEIKTPVNAIEGYATLLQDGDNLDADQREYVEKILFNTKRLSSLVSNVLLLSKIENQLIPAKRERYALDEQIRETVVALESAWAQKSVELDVELCSAAYFGNEALMRHVWSNLIGNAIKFSPCGGKVCLRLAQNEDRLIFTVSDEGEGLSPEAEAHLFDQFYQADTSHKEEGNGLGLALVKRILLLEGGAIRAENKEKGCVFTVILNAE